MLEHNMEYYWKVDAILENEELVNGETWSFKTENNNIEIS